MAIRKLTLAAAISVGMLSVASPASIAAENTNVQPDASIAPVASEVMAADTLAESGCGCPTPMPVVTGPACPTQCDPCDPCYQPQAVDPSAIQKYKLRQESATGAACPCDPCDPCQAAPCPAAPCPNPCDPCADPCDPCPACPVDTCDPCEMSKPASGLCPSVSEKAKLNELQVYAYPSTVFGQPSAYQAGSKSLSLGDNQQSVSVAREIPTAVTGQPGQMATITDQFGCGTGAAAAIPCPCNPCESGKNLSGVGVNRDPLAFEGALDPIQVCSESSIDVIKIAEVPVQLPTGAAAPMTSSFQDIPDGFWANPAINQLVEKNIIAGYPDRTFKPNLPVSRAEFATMMVLGLNLQGEKTYQDQLFDDVPNNHWANSNIDKAVNHGLIAGYPDNTYHPGEPVTRVEALAAISKALCGDVSKCDADAILSSYKDGAQVPGWAKMAVAQALNQGVLKNTPCPDMIMPLQDATRAEIASMLSELRIALGYDCAQTACAPTGCAATVKQQQIVSLPTLKIKMEDGISSKVSHAGDTFYGESLEPITINCTTYPTGSKVKGKIVEIIRPDSKTNGAMKVVFTEIMNGNDEAILPRQLLTAQVKEEHIPNGVARTVKAPFVWTGRILGNVGRTVGGAVVVTGNAVEEVSNNVGIAAQETFQGKFRAAGRSIGQSVIALGKAPIDVTRTAIMGAGGLFSITTDELSYLVNPDGKPIASLNPNEVVNIAFGCQ